MSSFGVTLLMISSLLLIVITVVALATFIIKRTGYQGRLKKRIN